MWGPGAYPRQHRDLHISSSAKPSTTASMWGIWMGNVQGETYLAIIDQCDDPKARIQHKWILPSSTKEHQIAWWNWKQMWSESSACKALREVGRVVVNSLSIRLLQAVGCQALALILSLYSSVCEHKYVKVNGLQGFLLSLETTFPN